MRRAGVFCGVTLAMLVLGCGRSSFEDPLSEGSGGGLATGGRGGSGTTGGGGGSGAAEVGGSSGAGSVVGGSSGAGGAGSGETGGANGTAGGGARPSSFPDFISREGVNDVVYDGKRGVLYLSTGDSGVLRYDPRAKTFGAPLPVSGTLLGMALSPDESMLVVADDWYQMADASTFARNRIHVVALETETVRTYEFADEVYEGGTYIPAFIDDSTILVSARYPGSGFPPLRRVDIRDGSYEIIDDPSQDTALLRSADGSVIAYASRNNSGGPFGFYDVATGELKTSGTEWFNHTIGVSRDGSQFAVPTYFGMFVYDRNLAEIAKLGTYAKVYPAGVVYSPVADQMVLFWEDHDFRHPSLEVYDTNTFERVSVLDAMARFPSNRFAPALLRISRDGRLLFVLGYEGVTIRELDVAAP